MTMQLTWSHDPKCLHVICFHPHLNVIPIETHPTFSLLRNHCHSVRCKNTALVDGAGPLGLSWCWATAKSCGRKFGDMSGAVSIMCFAQWTQACLCTALKATDLLSCLQMKIASLRNNLKWLWCLREVWLKIPRRSPLPTEMNNQMLALRTSLDCHHVRASRVRFWRLLWHCFKESCCRIHHSHTMKLNVCFGLFWVAEFARTHC